MNLNKQANKYEAFKSKAHFPKLFQRKIRNEGFNLNTFTQRNTLIFEDKKMQIKLERNNIKAESNSKTKKIINSFPIKELDHYKFNLKKINEDQKYILSKEYLTNNPVMPTEGEIYEKLKKSLKMKKPSYLSIFTNKMILAPLLPNQSRNDLIYNIDSNFYKFFKPF